MNTRQMPSQRGTDSYCKINTRSIYKTFMKEIDLSKVASLMVELNYVFLYEALNLE